MSELHTDTIDAKAFSVMFAIDDTVDFYSRKILIEGYKRIAYLTTMQLSRFML